MTDTKTSGQASGAASISPKIDNPSDKSRTCIREEAVLAKWRKEKTFEASVANPAGRTEPLGEFTFYDGPPFATGSPHYGHILASTIKDAIPRYKTMRGYRVHRRWGWDCHGLPIENLVEKELGFKSKVDIEHYGLEKFTEVARDFVLRYTHIWREQVPRFGRFVDIDNDYRTMDPSYTESVWWVFKTLYEKGLIYEGFKSMQMCPRCGTTLSNFEVNQGYKDITDISVYALFRLVDDPKTALLAWTTTPWTLPGNAALAINPDIQYVKVKLAPAVAVALKLGYVIVAADRLKALLKVAPDSFIDPAGPAAMASKANGREEVEPEIVAHMKGSLLVGRAYTPLFSYYANDTTTKHRANGWKIYPASFVTTTDGTGVVHIAPAFGSDDYDLSLKYNLPFIQHVAEDGRIVAKVKEFAGLPAKPKSEPGEKDGHQKTDIAVIKYLAASGALFAKEKLIHSYPHCWRCETPLLNYAASSWFVKVTALKDALVAENKRIAWVPPEVGRNRFGDWLSGARDWAISRSRYWGAPIPVWKSVDGKEVKVLASVADFKRHAARRNTYFVVRHGQSESNVAGRVSSAATQVRDSLTPEGRAQAQASAQALHHTLGGKKIDMIIASPYTRTRETAEIIQKTLGLPADVITFDERLIEVGAPGFDGKHWDDVMQHFSTRSEMYTKDLPGFESLTKVRNRIAAALYDIDARYEGKTILIVSHGTPVRLVHALAAGHDTDVGFHNPVNGQINPVDFVALPRNDRWELDYHRPFIDTLKIVDAKGRPMKRVADVFDCWFESGSMPYGQMGYTGTPVKKFGELFDPSVPAWRHLLARAFTFMPGKWASGMYERLSRGKAGYPAAFIAEGLDQTRGWFYSLLVLGVALFGRAPYRHVIVNGLVLAEDGKKMSKSLKNYPDPMDVIKKYGMDAMRITLLASPAVRAEDLCFSEKAVDEVAKKIINRLDNMLSFYEMYAGERVSVSEGEKTALPASSRLLDRWIISRLNSTVSEVTTALERYELNTGFRPIADLIEDMSLWYVRRSRDRFKSDNHADRKAALATYRHVLEGIAKLLAPYAPFMAEYVYGKVVQKGKLGSAESVHLTAWPTVGGIDAIVLKDMHVARTLITTALEARSKSGIKIRQPLASLTLQAPLSDVGYADLIADEVNVKTIHFDATLKQNEVRLDTTLTAELRREGALREMIRTIQDARKEAGMVFTDRPTLIVNAAVDADRAFIAMKPDLIKETGLAGIRAAHDGEAMPYMFEGDAPFGLIGK